MFSIYEHKECIEELFFTSAIITENIIIKPPIDKVVFIAFSIEFLIAVPKLKSHFLFKRRELLLDEVLFFFVIIPIKIIDK